MRAHRSVEPPVGGIDFFDDLSWRDDQRTPSFLPVIFFVVVHPSCFWWAVFVAVVPFDPADFVEDNLVRDVGGVVRIQRIGCLNVDDGQVGGPLRPDLQQQLC